MSRKTQETIAASAFLALFIGAAVLSLGFGPRARMIPLPLAIFGALLAMIQLLLIPRGGGQRLKMDLINLERPAAGREAGEDNAVRERSPSKPRIAAAYAIVGGLLALVLAIGPVAAVFLFTAGYFIKTRYCSVPLAVLYTAVFTAIVYLLFFVALQIPPFHGMLAPLIVRLE